MKIKLLLAIIVLSLLGCTSNNESEENSIPIINEISNNVVEIGDEIIIDGTNFNKNISNYVIKLNGVEAEIIYVSSTQIKVKVPNNVTSGVITFAVNNNEPIVIGNITITSLKIKWFLESSSFNGIPNVMTDCDRKSYIKFSSEGTFERAYYFFNGSDCLPEGKDIGTYTYNSSTNKITLSFNDPDDGNQIEKFNNVELTENSFKYSWDEDGDGTDDIERLYKK